MHGLVATRGDIREAWFKMIRVILCLRDKRSLPPKSDCVALPSVGVRVAFIFGDGAPVELLEFCTANAVRPKTRHVAEQRAAPDERSAKKMGRRR